MVRTKTDEYHDPRAVRIYPPPPPENFPLKQPVSAPRLAALLLFALCAFAAPTSHAQTAQTVPANSSLIPAGLTAGGSFRLLFVTSGTRDATSSDITDYNTFVQNQANAATGDNAPIAAFNTEFRALTSTTAVDARDNTATNRVTSSDTDAPIYWLNGEKIADNYEGFYDGTWDSTVPTSQDGGTVSNRDIFTGSNNEGIEHIFAGLSRAVGETSVAFAGLNGTSSSNLFTRANAFAGQSQAGHFYALSPIITAEVSNPPTFGAATIPNQIYPQDTAISFALPTASGGNSPLTYTLTRDAGSQVLPTGMSFVAGTTPTISGRPTATFFDPGETAAELVYTVRDAISQTDALTFTVKTVAVTVADGTVDYLGDALAAINVGGNSNNDMRLTLPPGNSVSDVAVTFYDPSTSTVAVPDGVIFSGVAMDIALTPAGATSLPTSTTATVCLSTVGATGRTALYHLPTSATAWEAIGSETGRFPGFVCGATTAFSPFAVGSLEIEDARLSAISRTILPEVARAITDTTVSAIARRLHHAGADSHESGSVTLAGQSTLADILTTGGQALADGTLNLHDMVGRSAFVLPLNQAGDLVKGLTLWGGGDYRAIGGSGDATDWDGALFSARLGADARVRANLLTGAALSWTQGDFEYGALADDPTGGGGDYTLRMTSLTPYVGWSVVPAGGLDVWATAGYGWGEVSITDTIVDARQTSDATTVMVGGGVSAQVLKTRTSRVRVKGELMQTSMDLDGHDRIGALTVEARRARLQVEGRHEYELAGGGRLGGTLEAGLRRDGGDGLTGTGAEMGGGVQYRHPAQGVTLSGQGRVLLGHTSNYEDWGIGAALTVIPGQGGEGLALRLSPTYGQTVTNTAQLWDQSAANLTGTDAAAVGRRMDAEVGYGLAIADGQNLLTPYGKLTWGQGTRNYRLGSRLTLASGLNLSLESRRGETPGAATDHGVLLNVVWGW